MSENAGGGVGVVVLPAVLLDVSVSHVKSSNIAYRILAGGEEAVVVVHRAHRSPAEEVGVDSLCVNDDGLVGCHGSRGSPAGCLCQAPILACRPRSCRSDM